jgi:Flp pilus assembly pilin Flp
MGKVLRETMTLTFTSVALRLQQLVRRASAEDGQAMVEYALLLSLIAIVAFGTINAFGHGVSGLYSQIESGVKAGMP